jgi:hypothetical protein
MLVGVWSRRVVNSSRWDRYLIAVNVIELRFVLVYVRGFHLPIFSLFEQFSN